MHCRTRSARRVAAAMAMSSIGSLCLLTAPPAQAVWHFSAGSLIDIRLACRDGVRVGLAVIGSERATQPYLTRLVATQPPPQSWSNTTPRQVDSRVSLPALAAPTTVIAGEAPGSAVEVTHLGQVSAATKPGVLMSLGAVAVTGQRDITQSNVNVGRVIDCRLFAPIDIVPGRASNPVRVGRGDVSVAVLGTPTMRADRIKASARAAFRFGPSSARVVRSVISDVNRDGRADVLFTFRSKASGITCATTRATLIGTTPSGARLEGNGRISPVGC